MKLIIDIPDDYMKYIDIYEKGSLFDMVLTGAIKNGIPLDKIKAEIREHCERHFIDGDIIAADVLEIINKHIGESEDKE